MLRSLDLFSGLGGFSIAMRGFAKTVGYCEMDPNAQCVLRTQMEAGNLERAPVFPDVANLHASDVGAVDVIMGGWPCQDNSPMGLRKGAGGSRSGLLRHALRLAEESGAPMLFLENVPASLHRGLEPILKKLVADGGYDISWCTIPASAVGAPHVRKRLFILAVKRGFEHSWPALGEYVPFDWSRTAEPPRTVSPLETVHARWKRVAMTGNAVVPDCVRMAFVTLATGFRIAPAAGAMNVGALELVSPRSLAARATPHRHIAKLPWAGTMIGASDGDVAIAAVSMPNMRVPTLDLTFDPAAYVGQRRQQLPRGVIASPTLTDIQRATSWATPRMGSSAGHVLTQRMIRDLPTQVRFEIGTPESDRGGKLAPDFVGWMMGFPAGWTALPEDMRACDPIGYRQKRRVTQPRRLRQGCGDGN